MEDLEIIDELPDIYTVEVECPVEQMTGEFIDLLMKHFPGDMLIKNKKPGSKMITLFCEY